MAVETGTNENFQDLISSGVVIADFWAEWCGPCRMLAPVLEEVSDEVEGVKFVSVNVEEAEKLASEQGIRNLPTLIAFKDGQKVDVKVGSESKKNLIDWVESLK